MTAWWALLLGWFTGAGCVLCFVGLRWYLRPSALREECRRLREQRDEHTAQLAYLYQDRDRLARQLVDGIGRPGTARNSEVA